MKLRSHLFRALRIVVSVGLLAWLIMRIDRESLADTISRAKVLWIVVAFGINSLGNVFGALRWQLLLKSQGRHVSLPFLYGSYLVGLLFNNFLPSTIGGDVYRALSAKSKGGGTKTENLTVVLVERQIGLLATLTLGGLAALHGEASRLDPRVPWALGGALVASIAGLYLAISNRVRHQLLGLVDRLPVAFVRRTLGKMLAAFELFSRAHPALLANYALSLGFQFLLILHFFVIQFAFGESVPLLTFIVVVPLVFCVMLLPIGINGLGVREVAFVWFLTRAGMQEESALALSLTSYVIAVGQGVIGGFVYFSRGIRGPEGHSADAAAAPEA